MARLLFDKLKQLGFKGWYVLHIFFFRMSSQLKEICDNEKRQFWRDSVPLKIN